MEIIWLATSSATRWQHKSTRGERGVECIRQMALPLMTSSQTTGRREALLGHRRRAGATQQETNWWLDSEMISDSRAFLFHSCKPRPETRTLCDFVQGWRQDHYHRFYRSLLQICIFTLYSYTHPHPPPCSAYIKQPVITCLYYIMQLCFVYHI